MSTRDEGELAFLDATYFGNSVRSIYFILLVGSVLAFGIFISSHKKKMPAYDIVFAILGFFMSIYWINIVAD